MLKNRDSIEDGYALYHSVGHRPNGSQEMAAAVSDFSLMWTAPIPDAVSYTHLTLPTKA